jgi:ubiquinone/menaquinone biosynthesis C-methylase UbiE
VADLILGDVLRLPFASGYADVIFAGGLLPHLKEPVAGLLELARVVRPGRQLAVFHSLGRVTLAARHNHAPSDDDVLSAKRLRALCEQTGWQVSSIDDSDDRYLALAVRQ